LFIDFFVKIGKYPLSETNTMSQLRGVGRMKIKLETAIREERYYEAHQLYRTLHFRFELYCNCQIFYYSM